MIALAIAAAIGSCALSACGVTWAALRFARQQEEREAAEDARERRPAEPVRIYPFFHPRPIGEVPMCPLCGTNCKDGYGVQHVPAACNPPCGVRAPHLHARCEACCGEFLTATHAGDKAVEVQP